MSLDPHHVAILALLRAPGALPAPIVAYTDAIPDGTYPPYVRVFLSVAYPGMEDLTFKSNRAVARAELVEIVLHETEKNSVVYRGEDEIPAPAIES